MDPLTIAAVGLPLLGAASSAFGQRSANKTNVKLARERMQFEEQMSSTAWQRGTDDMRKAGINPMLAAGLGGATGGSGAQAQVGNVGAAATEGASSAMAMRVAKKNVDLMDQNIQHARAVTAKEKWLGDQELLKYRAAEARYGFYFDKDGNPKAPLRNLLQMEHNASMANTARSVSESRLSALSIPERRALAKLFDQVGSGGKSVQLLLPLLSRLMSRN